MIPAHVKVGQRWLLTQYNGYNRIEEVISITDNRGSAKVIVKQCLHSEDFHVGHAYTEDYFDTIKWTLLEGQDAPSV